jgi:hypothetical protein
MRVNIITRPSNQPESNLVTVPLSLTIRPACGLPGDYDWQTDSKSLLRLLKLQTDLPATTLKRFEEGLRSQRGARLMGVDLNDRVLTQIGYFID